MTFKIVKLKNSMIDMSAGSQTRANMAPNLKVFIELRTNAARVGGQ